MIQLADMVGIVAHYFDIDPAVVVGPVREARPAFVRHVAMYMCKRHLLASFPEIGHALGHRHHSTVIHGVRKIDALRLQRPDVAEHLAELARKCRNFGALEQHVHTYQNSPLSREERQAWLRHLVAKS